MTRRPLLVCCLLVTLAAGAETCGASRFPFSCMLDLRSCLTAPAGHRGFLFVGTDGRFYFADGTRARFWGINVAKDSVFQPREVIDEVTDLFARSGFNLVRLHHVDDVGGLLPPERIGLAERLDPKALDALDYWIHACKQRGLYVYLDLLDYRTFSEKEGVPNGTALGRGAKPVALFNEKVISLQMEFAEELLVRHVNPYTGLRYRDDPAICLLEICDENSLVGSVSKWGRIPSPYREELIRRWNFYLRQRYGTTAALQAAWGTGSGGLRPNEKLENGSVALPGVSPDLAGYQVREPDVRRFAAGLERDYLTQMVTFLRNLGVKVPITAVTEPDSPASLLAAADTLDFITGNYYHAHPIYKETYPPEVKSTFEFCNMLSVPGPDTAARRLCGSRVAGKPLVIREWNCCWPNPYRAAGLLEAAALGAKQDLDAMILFAYYTTADNQTLSPFDLSHDPPRWGLVALAGEVFRDPALIGVGPRVAVLWDEASVYNQPRGALASEIFDAARVAVMENWLPGHEGREADAYALVSPAAAALLPRVASAEAHVSAGSLPELSAALRAMLTTLNLAPGPIRWNPVAGTFSLAGEKVWAVAGRAAEAMSTPDGELRLTSSTPRMALVWLSRDGQPPSRSGEWVAKMVTGAWNTGEQVRSHYNSHDMNVAALLSVGGLPVTTGGKPSDIPTVLTVGSRQVLSIWMRGGVWELHQTAQGRRLYCDTSGIRFEFPDLPGAVAIAETEGGQMQLEGPPWAYPEKAKWVEVALQTGEASPDER